MRSRFNSYGFTYLMPFPFKSVKGPRFEAFLDEAASLLRYLVAFEHPKFLSYIPFLFIFFCGDAGPLL